MSEGTFFFTRPVCLWSVQVFGLRDTDIKGYLMLPKHFRWIVPVYGYMLNFDTMTNLYAI